MRRSVAWTPMRLAKSRIPARENGGQASHSAGFVAGSDQLVQRCQEAVVLPPRAVGDAHPALLAQRFPGANDHALLREAVHDLALVALAERDPGEVRLAVRALESPLLELRLRVHALDGVLLAPPLDLVLVIQRLGRGRQGQRVYGERLAYAIHREPEFLRPERVAHAQTAEAVDLGEGAQQDE